MEWIKFADKQPPPDTTVMVMRRGYNIHDAIYYTNIEVARYKMRPGSESGFAFNDVTHWMPLSDSVQRLSKADLMRMYEEKLNEENR